MVETLMKKNQGISRWLVGLRLPAEGCSDRFVGRFSGFVTVTKAATGDRLLTGLVFLPNALP